MNNLATVIALVAAKISAQLAVLESDLTKRLVAHAELLMAEAPDGMIADAFRTAGINFVRRGTAGAGPIAALIGGFVHEMKGTRDALLGRLADGAMPNLPYVAESYRDLDRLFAIHGTRRGALTMTPKERESIAHLVRTFEASLAPDAFRRIVSAYRFEVGDYDREIREERVFCDLAAAILPSLGSYHHDLLTIDRDTIAGMCGEHVGLVIAKGDGCGTWWLGIPNDNGTLESWGRKAIEDARAIALVTYERVAPLNAHQALALWHRQPIAAAA